MSLNFVVGDATNPQVPGKKIIAHCCNDVGVWGAGFVMALSRRWKAPELDYRGWFTRGAPVRLGAVRFVGVTDEIEVANIVDQRGIETIDGVPPVRYDAIASGLSEVAKRAKYLAASVHMPRMGCGLAGGEWSRIQACIAFTLGAAGVPTYVYDLPTGGAR